METCTNETTMGYTNYGPQNTFDLHTMPIKHTEDMFLPKLQMRKQSIKQIKLFSQYHVAERSKWL